MPIRKRILMIDDEAAIRKLLRTAMDAQKVEFFEAASGKEGIAQAIAVKPDAILLDLGLPDQDGIEVLKALRKWYERPLLVLSVRSQEETIINALDQGADDYLTKPFNLNELFARLRVAERHFDKQESLVLELPSGVKIDLTNRLLTKNGEEIRITVTEYEVLKVLVRNQGKVLTHRQLLHEVWGPNSAEHVQYLRVYVGHLRQKLEEDPNNPKVIITEPGVGYRMIIPD